MTPTEQDKELAEKIGNVLDDLLNTEMPARFHNTDWAEYTIARLITADRERVALEARIDELERVYPQLQKHYGVSGEGNYYYDDRIAELKAQQEEL